MESGRLIKIGSERSKHFSALAFLFGPFRLKFENGLEFSVGSQLRQAILAVLLTAPDQSRSRKFLQEMFWGSVGARRASANLRQALYLLKHDLRGLGDDIVRTDRNIVALAPGRIEVAPSQPGGAEFLEGLDLALDDCELFEDWLRAQRQSAATTDAREAPGLIPAFGRTRLALGLFPNLHAGISLADKLRSDSIVDSIAHFVAQTSSLDVHDLRGYDVRAVPLPVESGKGATHFLQTVVERRGGLLLRLRLHEAATRRLVWVSDPIDALAADQEEEVASVAETLLAQMALAPGADSAPDLYPWTAITAFFSLDEDLINRTEAQLIRMIDAGAPPVFECLRVFGQIFKANEGLARPEVVSAADLCELLGSMPDAHPMLPLCESLLGYSAHMLAGENDLAEMLIEDADRRAPNLSLNLDHLAVIRLMRGDLPGAHAALARCLRVGATSPWRYTYDVSGAMISMATGDVRKSLYFANRALFRKPRFIGALRYAMAGFSLAGQPRDALRMKVQIQRLRPNYDLSEWMEGMLRRTPRDFGQRLTQSLQRDGIG